MSTAYARTAVLCFIAFSLLSGCATKMYIQGRFAPRELSGSEHIRRIAVWGFRGPGGKATSHDLEADLVDHKFNGTPYFTVVERNNMRAIMAEYAKGLTGQIDPKTAAKFGRQIGAQGILFGAVTESGVVRSYRRETEQRCVKTGAFGICTQFQPVSVLCKINHARFGVTVRLVDVDYARIVYAKHYIGAANSDSCRNTALAVDLMEQARAEALSNVVRDIAPYNATLTVALKTRAPGLTKNEQARFSGAAAFAKAGRMGRACRMWRALNDHGRKNVSVLYDLSVCAEVAGHLRESLALLKEADGLLLRPDTDIDNSLKRVRLELAQRHGIAKSL